MKTRIDLAKYFKELGFSVGAEVGVHEGYFSEKLCENIPGLELYCIDIWEKLKGSTGRPYYYDVAKQRLAHYNCKLIKNFSMEAVKDFADDSLDFVYIDGHHGYDYVKEDIREWAKKVRPGGIVSGHDYYPGKSGGLGVVQAVDEYVKEHGYSLQITEWNRHGRHKDNWQPSWYFIKP